MKLKKNLKLDREWYTFSMQKTVRLIFLILACEAVGIAGSAFTLPAISTWYATLTKPGFSPPNSIFGPVWTALYALMGISAYVIWESKKKQSTVTIALYYFGAQLFLNLLWSFLFFGLRSPLFALIELVVLWLFILLTIKKFLKISHKAAYLLLPYLAWVSFALILNFAIVVLNP